MSNTKINISNVNLIVEDLTELINKCKNDKNIITKRTSSININYALESIDEKMTLLISNLRKTKSYIDFYLQDIESFDNALRNNNILKSNYVSYYESNYKDAISKYYNKSINKPLTATDKLSGTSIWKKTDVEIDNKNAGNQVSEVNKETDKLTNPVEENTAKDVSLKEETYVVKSGDTLYGISKKYNINIDELYAKNKNIIGGNASLIEVGMVLTIPNSSKKEEVINNNSDLKESVQKKTTESQNTVKETQNTKTETLKENIQQTKKTEIETENLGNHLAKENGNYVLKNYRITSYYPGDDCKSVDITATGKSTKDFDIMYIGNKRVYTYQGKIVVAAATNALYKSGYSKNNARNKPADKYYFDNYDTLTINIDGTDYDAIVLDCCGASMWEGEYRIDIYVPSSKDVIDRNNVTAIVN